MDNKFEYKSFKTEIQVDCESEIVYCFVVTEIGNIISAEAKTVKELKGKFATSVELYLSQLRILNEINKKRKI